MLRHEDELKGYFFDAFDVETLSDAFSYIIEKANEKNARERPFQLTEGIESRIKEIEGRYGVQGLPKGLSQEQAMNFFKEMIDLQAKTDHTFNPHNYIAHMLLGVRPTPGILGAISGYLMDGNGVTAEVSNFASRLHKGAGEMLKEMFGYKPGTWEFEDAVAILTIGGTEANSIAMTLGRNWAYLKGKEKFNIEQEGFMNLCVSPTRSPIIIIPESAHYSIDRISGKTGIGRSNVLKVRSDSDMRMDVQDLEEILNKINPKTTKLLSVMAVFGSTETGAIDDIAKVADLVEAYEQRTQEKVWKHLDAAYGGPFMLLDRFKDKREQAKRFDSLTVDPHKMLFTPYNSGGLLVRDGVTLRSITTDAAYINNGNINGVDNQRFLNEIYEHVGAITDNGSINPAQFSGMYFQLKCLGTDVLRAAMERSLENAKYFADQLNGRAVGAGKVEVINPHPDTNLVVFRYVPNKYAGVSKSEWATTDERIKRDINALNMAIFREFTTSKEKYALSKTRLGTYDMIVSRACLMSPQLERADIDEFVKSYAAAIRRIG